MQTDSERNLKPLSNLNWHVIGYFPDPLLSRQESLEDTLQILRLDDSMGMNEHVLSRLTHVYGSERHLLEPVITALSSKREISDARIIHESSDLGFPYKIVAGDGERAQLVFDGFEFRLTEQIHQDPFGLHDIVDIAGYRPISSQLLHAFTRGMESLNPENELPLGYTFTTFYTASVENWGSIGLRNDGNAKLKLICTDEKIMTITALIHTAIGKDYSLCIGEEKEILEMIAHDMAIGFQIGLFNQYIDGLRSSTELIEGNSLRELQFLLKPLTRLSAKQRGWTSSKRSLESLLNIHFKSSKLRLLAHSLETLISNRTAYVNAPRQIWLAGDEVDQKKLIQRPTSGFYEAKLVDGKISDFMEGTIRPSYTSKAESLISKHQALVSLGEELLTKEREILTAFQTEFSLYGVWIALAAILISVLSLLIVSM